MTRPTLRGAYTALVTPFTSDGALDEAAFRRLVRWQVLAGIDGIVPCGTTGEAPTLSADERDLLIAATVEIVAERPSRGRIQVIAGTGTNDTAATIARHTAGRGAGCRRRARRGALLQPARRADARGALPGRRRRGRPADRRLQRAVADRHQRRRRHVPAARRASAGRSRSRRPAATSSRSPRICAERPRDVAVLAGDDAWTLPVLALGGDGVVSVASNEIPGELVALCAAAHAGDWEAAGGPISGGCRCSSPTSGEPRTRCP